MAAAHDKPVVGEHKYEADAMIVQHWQTWRGLTRYAFWAAVHVAILLILMAIFLT